MRVGEHASAPLVPRSPNEILRLFDGFELVSPGLVPPAAWRPGPDLDPDGSASPGVGGFYVGGPHRAGTGSGTGTLTITVGAPRWLRHTPTVANRLQPDVLPELDLLAAIFRHHGVAQLESSRGCTDSCSFCPRAHKGQWAGTDPQALGWLLAEMDQIFRRYPQVSRTIDPVDCVFPTEDATAVHPDLNHGHRHSRRPGGGVAAGQGGG